MSVTILPRLVTRISYSPAPIHVSRPVPLKHNRLPLLLQRNKLINGPWAGHISGRDICIRPLLPALQTAQHLLVVFESIPLRIMLPDSAPVLSLDSARVHRDGRPVCVVVRLLVREAHFLAAGHAVVAVGWILLVCPSHVLGSWIFAPIIMYVPELDVYFDRCWDVVFPA